MATSEEGVVASIQVPLVWVGAEETPIYFCNQFLAQVDGNEAFLMVGQMTPPPLMGSPEEIQEQAERITYVAVKAVARLGMASNRLDELINVLQQIQSIRDQRQGARS